MCNFVCVVTGWWRRCALKLFGPVLPLHARYTEVQHKQLRTTERGQAVMAMFQHSHTYISSGIHIPRIRQPMKSHRHSTNLVSVVAGSCMVNYKMMPIVQIPMSIHLPASQGKLTLLKYEYCCDNGSMRYGSQEVFTQLNLLWYMSVLAFAIVKVNFEICIGHGDCQCLRGF